jgi:molybdopterin converting factor subunit 1
MRVLLFAHLKTAAGCSEFSLAGNGLNTAGLWQKIVEVHPVLARFRDSVRLAKNSEYVAPDARFCETDEVALIPPVSGG